jgi:hypothetical protein
VQPQMCEITFVGRADAALWTEFEDSQSDHYERSVVLPGGRKDFLYERDSSRPGPQQWSTFRKPVCRNGRDAGSIRRLHFRASCASNDPKTETQRSASTAEAIRRRSRSAFHVPAWGRRGAAVCVDCEGNKQKVSQRLPHSAWGSWWTRSAPKRRPRFCSWSRSFLELLLPSSPRPLAHHLRLAQPVFLDPGSQTSPACQDRT